MDQEISEVAEWYSNRSVLVTGATGFMGKVLVEKLLRSCPNIKTIYALVRPKKGHTPEQRLQKEILNAQLFDTLREIRPEALDKVKAIKADILCPDLGIDQDDRTTLIENVTVVFHSAATVKFDEALKLSIAMNIVGTGVLLKLCEKMKSLDAFIHVSTAYCNCHLQEIGEEIYPAPTNLDQLLKYVENLDDDVINAMTSRLICNRPNTYTFTKSLAEHLLSNHSPAVPCAIVRPSIVTSSWKEPVPGWVDNLNGPTGMLVAGGKGVMRTMLVETDLVADFIPVDVVIGFMICVAWYTGTKRPKGLQIYNCTSGTTNPMYWRDFYNYGKKAVLEYPYSGILWYPEGSLKTSKFYNNICCFAFHTIPAYLLDFVSLIMGKKRIMVRIRNKIAKAMNTLEYFTNKEWKFISNNMFKVLDCMSPTDRKIFNFDIRSLDWGEYLTNFHLGTRKFILKESEENLPEARKHLQRMKILHYCVQCFFYLLFYFIFIHSTSIDSYFFGWICTFLHIFNIIS